MNIIKLFLLAFLAVGVIYILILRLFIRFSKKIHLLNADEFEKQLIATKDAQLIDVRTPREFEKYHIAGAKNIDYLSVGFCREIRKLDKSKPIMIYCHSGYRSKMTCRCFAQNHLRTSRRLSNVDKSRKINSFQKPNAA